MTLYRQEIVTSALSCFISEILQPGEYTVHPDDDPVRGCRQRDPNLHVRVGLTNNIIFEVIQTISPHYINHDERHRLTDGQTGRQTDLP